jgi:hypothetical protein
MDLLGLTPVLLHEPAPPTLVFFLSSESKTGSVRGVDTSGRREDLGNGYRKVNMVGILCTHVMKMER